MSRFFPREPADSLLKPSRRARRSRRPGRSLFRPELEQLENLCLLTLITWTGNGTDDLWSNAANWNLGVPQDHDDVVIPPTNNSNEVLFDASVLASGVTLNRLDSDEPFHITGSTLTLDGSGTFLFDAGLTLSGGTITGPDSFTVSGLPFSWSGGTLSGSGIATVQGGLSATGGTKTLSGRMLNLDSNTTWTAGTISLESDAVINNLVGRTFDMQGDLILDDGDASDMEAFNNQGTFRKSSGTALNGALIGLTFNVNGVGSNQGAVDIQAGTLRLASMSGTAGGTFTEATVQGSGKLEFNGSSMDTWTFSGTTSLMVNTVEFTGGTVNFNAATVDADVNALTVSGGTVNIIAGSSLMLSSGQPYQQTSGSTTLNTGTLEASLVDIQAGSLSGTGTIIGNVQNAGQLNPGLSPGVFTIDGNYTQAALGTLNVELNGTAAGTGYDQLIVNGDVMLDGTLNATLGFSFVEGDTFLILDNTASSAVAGTFAGLLEGQFVTFANGRRAQITYQGGLTNNDVVLVGANAPPTLGAIGSRMVDEETQLTFTATVTDPDLPASTPTFSLDTGAPSGAAIDPMTGVFTWTPTEADGPGTYLITVRVTDNGTPNLDDAETIPVTVNEVNQAPVLSAIGNKMVDEQTALTFTAMATDADVPSNTLTFSLDAGAPAGATIDPMTGAFNWTPPTPGNFDVTIRVTDDGNPMLSDAEMITITVLPAAPINQPPVLAAIGNQMVDEGSLLTFTAMATDPNQGDTLLFALLNAPMGASIDGSTGMFTWTPTEDQGPATMMFTVRVTDNGGLFDEEQITVTVNEVNQAPLLGTIGNRMVDEETLLTFTATATEVDVPANSLMFSLDPGAPLGAAIDATTGVFTWTPTEDQGPGTVNITVRVSDSGSPMLSDFETIQVTVNEINRPPALDPINDRTVTEGTLLTFTATATDPDIPANGLMFSLDPGAPTGATIDANTGIFSWTPDATQGPGMYSITVQVTDNGNPALSDTATFLVTVDDSLPNLNPVATKDAGESLYRERGLWQTGTGGFQGSHRFQSAGTGSRTASWTIRVAPGLYEVFASWVAGANRATNAPYKVFDGATLRTVTPMLRNQQLAPDDGLFGGTTWESLGTFTISSGTVRVELSDNANGVVVADGILLVPSAGGNLNLASLSLAQPGPTGPVSLVTGTPAVDSTRRTDGAQPFPAATPPRADAGARSLSLRSLRLVRDVAFSDFDRLLRSELEHLIGVLSLGNLGR
jgi:hypothetical protein